MSAQIETLLTNKDLTGSPKDGNRYELIEGELYVSTAPELIHQRVIGKLHFAFAKSSPLLRDFECGVATLFN